jgi:hypothetical protein
MTRVGNRDLGTGSEIIRGTRRKEFSNAEVALGRGCQKIVLRVKVCVEIRVKNV